jgi:hypothetical protein
LVTQFCAKFHLEDFALLFFEGVAMLQVAAPFALLGPSASPSQSDGIFRLGIKRSRNPRLNSGWIFPEIICPERTWRPRGNPEMLDGE